MRTKLLSVAAVAAAVFAVAASPAPAAAHPPAYSSGYVGTGQGWHDHRTDWRYTPYPSGYYHVHPRPYPSYGWGYDYRPGYYRIQPWPYPVYRPGFSFSLGYYPGWIW